MSINYSVGHVVRTFPDINDGSFFVYDVVAFDDEKLVVIDHALHTLGYRSPDDIVSRFKVEMYAFRGKNGLYEIGDTVTVYGYEGKWKVEKFAQNPRSTETEWCAAVVHEDGKRRLFWPAHLLMRA